MDTRPIIARRGDRDAELRSHNEINTRRAFTIVITEGYQKVWGRMRQHPSLRKTVAFFSIEESPPVSLTMYTKG